MYLKVNTVPMCHFKVLCLDLPKVIPEALPHREQWMSQDTELALRAGVIPLERWAEQRVQRVAPAEQTGTGRRREHFAEKLLLQTPPTPIKAKDSVRVWNTRPDRPKAALGRREAHDAHPEREGGPQPRHFWAGLWKEFPRALHKKSFQKSSIKHTWRKPVSSVLSV